jgi:hypothetical protein
LPTLTVEISLNLKVPNPHTYWVIYSSTWTTIGYTLYGPTVNGVLWWIYMICGKVPIVWTVSKLTVDGLYLVFLRMGSVQTTCRWTVSELPVL